MRDVNIQKKCGVTLLGMYSTLALISIILSFIHFLSKSLTHLVHIYWVPIFQDLC